MLVKYDSYIIYYVYLPNKEKIICIKDLKLWKMQIEKLIVSLLLIMQLLYFIMTLQIIYLHYFPMFHIPLYFLMLLNFALYLTLKQNLGKSPYHLNVMMWNMNNDI